MRLQVDYPQLITNGIIAIPAIAYLLGWFGFEPVALGYLVLITWGMAE